LFATIYLFIFSSGFQVVLLLVEIVVT